MSFFRMFYLVGVKVIFFVGKMEQGPRDAVPTLVQSVFLSKFFV